MDSESQREWLDDDVTKVIVGKVRAKYIAASRAAMSALTSGDLPQIRLRAGRREGLFEALTILLGGKPKDGDEEEA